MQYAKLYQIGKEQLQKAGITDAELDARLLLEFICHTDRNALYAHGDQEIEDEKMHDFLQLIEKRAVHIPLQHLTGEQNFMGLDFLVNEHVLIPRQDTEILVEEIMRDLHDGIRILDMCTGSGCILALASMYLRMHLQLPGRMQTGLRKSRRCLYRVICLRR